MAAGLSHRLQSPVVRMATQNPFSAAAFIIFAALTIEHTCAFATEILFLRIFVFLLKTFFVRC